MELVKVFLEKYFKSEIPCSFLYEKGEMRFRRADGMKRNG